MGATKISQFVNSHAVGGDRPGLNARPAKSKVNIIASTRQFACQQAQLAFRAAALQCGDDVQKG